MNEAKHAVLNLDKIKALGSKERIRILEVLGSNILSWSELQKKLDVNPNSLNFHLTKLMHADLVLRKVVESKSGRPSTQYNISPEGKRYYETITGKKDA